MLSGSRIRLAIQRGQVFRNFSNHSEHSESKLNDVQSASVDLRIDRIFTTTKDLRALEKPRALETGLPHYSLRPGETIVVQIREEFSLSKDFGGVIFPPNRLSKKGIVMTNPGHIDPGFRGFITVCLVNVGRKLVDLNAGDPVATLLLWSVEDPTEGYQGPAGTGATADQLDCMDRDFAAVSARMDQELTSKMLQAFLIFIAVGTLILALVAIAVPMAMDRFESVDELHRKNLELEKKVKDLSLRLEHIDEASKYDE